MRAVQDLDDALLVVFKHLAQRDEAASLAAGRPIFEDIEICEVRTPGNKDVKVFPATFFSRWVDDPLTGEQRKQTYAERFRHQYQQFKRDAQQTKSGTPLDQVPFLTEGRRAELRAQNVYTVEQLALVDGAELKNLGPNGRDFKNAAMAYIEESLAGAPTQQMVVELEALRARNAVLEEDMQAARLNQRIDLSPDEGEFKEMDLDQIREFIKVHSGQEPIGYRTMNRKTLVRMAQSLRSDKVA